MIIYFNNTELDIPVDDNSYRNRTIKGDHSLKLYFSLPEHIEIPVGAWTEYQGIRYELLLPENFKKRSTRAFEYDLILEADQAKLKRYRFRDTNTRRVKFDLTARPQEHMAMLVENLNRREPGWTLGECIDATEKLIAYNCTTCWEALDKIASDFETEWEIVGKRISLKKVEYNKDNPLPLSYGKGNGFLPGVGRVNYDSNGPVEILLVQGGNKNINPSKYGHSELLLPKNQQYVYEGRTYITDEDGFSIRRADVELTTKEEGCLDCSHIHPKRVGRVTSVEVIDAENFKYDIIDETITFDYNEYLIEGYTMTLIFQEGMLAGKEFDVKYVHEEKRFLIYPQEYDGVTMPNESFKPLPGQDYIVYGMEMPEEYVCDNQNKQGASWDMFKEAVRYKHGVEDPRFTFSGELDGIWAKKDWLNIGGRILLGGYVEFSDTQFQPEGVLVRIVGIKDYINNPHSPKIDLSNTVISGSFATELDKADSNEIVSDSQYRAAMDFTRRRWRDLNETSEMLAKAIDGFSAEINPISISTMHIKIGSEQLQFRFVNSKTNPSEFIPDFVMNNSSRVFSVNHRGYATAFLQHMTLGIDNLSTTHAVSEYKFWQMSAFTSPFLGEDTSPLYLYAKCNKAGSSGEYMLSKDAIKMDTGDGFLYFLIGTLSSEWEGSRSFEACYGFTEILPGRMTVNLIKSTDGNTYFNLAEGEIGGNIRIISGTGYNNLKDKPDLSVYATSAELSVQANRITANVTAISKINSTIETAGWITQAQGNTFWASKSTFDSHVNQYNTFKSAIEQRADQIALSVNSGTGKMLYKDPEFSTGVNGTAIYNNSGGTGLLYERVAKTSDAPTGSSYMMRLTFFYGATTSPGLGGFRWGNSTRTNGVYEAHIIAKIPVGYKIAFASNATGDDTERTWLTSQEGTGKWETYIHRVRCGSKGTFSSTNFFYIDGKKPTVRYSHDQFAWVSGYQSTARYMQIQNDEGVWGATIDLESNPNANRIFWYVASATVYDLYTHEDIISEINMTPGSIKIKAEKIALEGTVTANGNVTINTDGSIKAIAGYIGSVQIKNGALNWSQAYMGYSQNFRIGPPSSSEGANSLIFASFQYNGSYSQLTRFGVRAQCTGNAAAAIYGSTKTSGSRTPGSYVPFAGYFDGQVLVRDHTQSESGKYANTGCFGLASNVMSSRTYRWISSHPPFSSSNDQYTYMNGVSFNQGYDLDNVRIAVRRGIVVGLFHDNGRVIYGQYSSNTDMGWSQEG